MENGLSLDFDSNPPECYEERNNKSARDNMQDLIKTVTGWEKENACVSVESKPLWVSPMSVSIEYDNTGSIKKKRPCVDLSRK